MHDRILAAPLSVGRQDVRTQEALDAGALLLNAVTQSCF